MTSNVATKQIYISDLHFEHRIWLSELKFRKEEINIFEKRLGEIVVRNSDKNMLAKLEQFQNQFIREKEVIDELRHKIKEHENHLAHYAHEHPVAIEHQHFGDHKQLRNEMKSFREIYFVLKEDFFRYLNEWM